MDEIKQLNDKLEKLLIKKNELEVRAKSEHENLLKSQEKLEITIKELEDLKDMETALFQKIVKLQKENLKDIMNFKSLKDKITEKANIFEDLKTKGKNLIGIVDTKINSQWFDENYTKYKNECKKIGEEIKSREDYKKVIDKLGGAIKSIRELDIIKLLNENEAEKNNSHFDIKINAPIEKLLKSKSEGFEKWIESKPTDLTYQSYINYLSENYKNGTEVEFQYKNTANSFKNLIKKIS